MTKKQKVKLCKCGELSDGWPDDMCQDCWEKHCSKSWWKEITQLKAALEELESIKDNLISKRASIQPNWLVKARQEEIAELKAEIARLNQELKVASEPSVIYIDEPPIEKRIRISKEQLNNQAKGNSLQQGVQETDVGAWIDRCHELGMLAKEQKAEIARLKALLDDGRVKLDDN